MGGGKPWIQVWSKLAYQTTGKHEHMPTYSMCVLRIRWIDYQNVPEEEERRHIRAAVAAHTRATGSRPLGLYQGKPNVRTRRLCVEVTLGVSSLIGLATRACL